MTVNELRKIAMSGKEQIENAILELLKLYPSGLSNQDFVDKLGLASSHEGRQKNYLTYSILGNLMEEGLIYKDKSSNRPVYKLKQANISSHKGQIKIL